jgi:MoaA/NifB/PqqE/SkfB family radical SAM enzyme
MDTKLRVNDCKMASPRAVDIIWNITLVCSWACPVCCVDAVHVAEKYGHITLRSKALKKVERIPFTPEYQNDETIFEKAVKYRQQKGEELNFEEKLKVLGNLQGQKVKLDFSGGDPLSTRENFTVMQAASSQFGRQQITLTATGAGLREYDPAKLAPVIGELNFTYDDVTITGLGHRPAGYATGNLKKAAQFVSAGVNTRAECPLTVRNANAHSIRQIYLALHESGIQKLLFIRLFPVGRGTLWAADIPTADQYRLAIDVAREMEVKYGFPKVKLQCALKWFDNQSLGSNPCDLFSESLGLSSKGLLLASPWAIGPTGDPLDDVWVLGNLSKIPLSQILNNEKAQRISCRLNDNFGHCKIQSYLYSTLPDKFERIFDKADPLYTTAG